MGVLAWVWMGRCMKGWAFMALKVEQRPLLDGVGAGRLGFAGFASGAWRYSLCVVVWLSLVVGDWGLAFGASDGYRALWRGGEYRAALKALDDQIAEAEGYVPVRMRRHRAELRFATGSVDDAIVEMQYVTNEYPEPSHTLELALMYRYRGLMTKYEQTLNRAAGQMRNSPWRYTRGDNNRVAIARILEILGENPKTILSAYYGSIFEQRPNMTVAYIGAGGLAYRKGGYDIAAKHFGRALELEPDNQEAMAGLCECYWKSQDGRLEETMQALLDLNPHHPRVRAIEVEQLLDLGKTDDALRLIQEALEVNPVSLRFRSLQSAALFLRDEDEAMERVQGEVLEFNPHCSEVFRTTGRLASRHYRFEEGAEFQRKALNIDPEDHEARALYTLDLMRLGEEIEGREELEKAFEADSYNVHVFNLLELMDTLKDFATVERGAFVLRLPEHEAPVLANDALKLLDRAIAHFEAKYDIVLARPVLVEMFDDHDDFMVRSVGLPGNVGHLGICFGKLITMDTPSARPKGSINWRSVLWHEFVHVITLQKTNNRMPRWLSEGVSVYEEGQYSPAWRNTLDPDYRAILAEEDLPGLRDLAGYFIQPRSQKHLLFGYFVAGEFVRFYVDTYGFEALKAALKAIGDGVAAEEALTEACGVSTRTVDAAFQADLAIRLEPFDNLPAVPQRKRGVLAKVAHLFGPPDPSGSEEDAEAGGDVPASPFTDALAKATEAIDAEQWDGAVAALEEAHELFPDYAGEDAPLRRLGALYAQLGDQEALKEILLKQIEWTPTELEACRKLVNVFRDAGEWGEVVRVADWALGIDPYDTLLHKALVEGCVANAQAHRALDSLAVLAHLDTAHTAEYRLERAEILTSEGEWAAAKQEVLEVLEEAPHYWEAQRLLLGIVERDGQGELTPEGAPAEPAAVEPAAAS